MVRSLEHGGCERDTAKIAVALDRDRFQPHVAVFVAGGFRENEVAAAGIPILHLPVNSFKNSSVLRGARLLGAYIRQHRIQLVQTMDVPMNMFGALVARWYGVPVVVTSQLSFRSMYSLHERLALRVTDRLSDRIVVNSRAVGRSLAREYGVPERKLYLCYNGVDTAQFRPGRRILPPGLERASLVVGSVCVMRSEKRVDWVLRSFAKIRDLEPEARLLLVGDGAEVPQLKAVCQQLGLECTCHFEPGQADVVPWLRCIDVYINSSSTESFPNGLLEAMACGCCVIGSAVGGIPELVTHMQDGLIFDPQKEDQLVEMLRLAINDAALRERLRRNAVETAQQRFSMEIAIARVESNYEELLDKRVSQESSRYSAAH